MKINTDNKCPVCKLKSPDVIFKEDSREKFTYKCPRCGKFKITSKTKFTLNRRTPGSKLTGWIRNLFELGMDIPEIDTKRLREIEKSIPDYNPADKQYLFLTNIARKSKYPGDIININPNLDFPLAWSSTPDEILFYIRFLVERGLLIWDDHKQRSELLSGESLISVALSPNGWNYLDNYEQRAIELCQAYVAMSFSESLKNVWEKSIKLAINDAGYKAFGVDSQQHNDKINAKMISEIRNSLFLVAEVTEGKKVVYFEAGYAIGRNLPVIWCVRKDALKNVYFDTNQYNHVIWETPDDLKEKLYEMICAVVGRRKKI